MGLDSLGAALKALPFKKPVTFQRVADVSDAASALREELDAFLESVGQRQFVERHTTELPLRLSRHEEGRR